MTPAPPQLHHIAVTVHDLDRSMAWYAAVFGVSYRMDVPHDGGIGKVMTDDSGRLALVLHKHDRTPDGQFSEAVVGLDHLGLAVASRDDLVEWQNHLATLGIEQRERADHPLTQSSITDEPYGSVLVFRDPDNIQLELMCTAPLS